MFLNTTLTLEDGNIELSLHIKPNHLYPNSFSCHPCHIANGSFKTCFVVKCLLCKNSTEINIPAPKLVPTTKYCVTRIVAKINT